MRRVDLIVSISADHQQVCQILSGEQVLQKVECCRIKPLQVVEKQGQRMFRTRRKSPINRRNARCARDFASWGGSAATDGCSPMINFNSGTRSTKRDSFGLKARQSSSRHRLRSVSDLLSKGRLRLWKACAKVAYGMSRLY